MKILIIGPSWVGDSVMAQTLYKRLKEESSECKIDVISQSGLQSLCKECPRSPKQLNLRTYMETLNFFLDVIWQKFKEI